tara:strand:- start:197 stop:793 length:597 start_codon:yes stop_codon:yes gene_type:complete
MLARALNRLRRDTRGSTIVEFAIIAPSFMILLMGVFDLGQAVYLRAVMNGAMQEAARDSTLESGPTAEAAIDGMVETRVQHVLRSAELSFDRKSYYDFTDIERAEAINDDNANGECDAGETFEDENGNGSWDSDVGSAGFGGARDITMYTVTATYDKLFPLYGLLGLPQEAQIEMSTVLKNQPYAQQGDKAVPETEPC